MSPAPNRRGEPERDDPPARSHARTRTTAAPKSSPVARSRTQVDRRPSRQTTGPPTGPRKDPTMKTLTQRLATLAVATVIALTAVPVLAADAPSGVVNINTATAAQLELLPGVGPAVAGRIV